MNNQPFQQPNLFNDVFTAPHNGHVNRENLIRAYNAQVYRSKTALQVLKLSPIDLYSLEPSHILLILILSAAPTLLLQSFDLLGISVTLFLLGIFVYWLFRLWVASKLITMGILIEGKLTFASKRMGWTRYGRVPTKEYFLDIHYEFETPDKTFINGNASIAVSEFSDVPKPNRSVAILYFNDGNYRLLSMEDRIE